VEPAKRAYVFLDESGDEEAVLTYGDLHARALAVAASLTESCEPGDRVLLLFPPGLDFIVAFFGCLYARVIAVPISAPRKNRVQDATIGIVKDSEPAVVLTVTSMLDSVRAPMEAACGHLPWIVVDDAGLPEASSTVPEPCDIDSVAFLQYTSGSTSAPKGVMVSHRNLIANQEMIQRAFGHDQHSTFAGWTPLFHDQGLIGNVLQPLYIGSTSVLMAPMTFIRRPLLWLSAISKYRAHTAGGPDFGFAACVARAGVGKVPELDLSCWKVAYNGAEPIRHETLRGFSERFAATGFSEEAFYPCYGLAEATLLVSGSVKGRGPRVVEADIDALGQGRLVASSAGRGQTVTGSGLVLPEEDVRIVDPESGLPSPAAQIGEVWVSGEHVAQGYWRNPEATAETFQARCDDEPDRTYLRTGDLGVVTDGELFVVGRLKDLIIVRGRNYYPHDIEHTVQSAHPALATAPGAAFSIPGADGERVIVVQEIGRDQDPGIDVKAVAAAVREAVLQEHEISLGDLVLTAPGLVQKTSSGKIRRAAARTCYLEEGAGAWVLSPAAG
jgi:acyl-CoA synthetase (AMP-forming)/AMP-acid ligase II